MKAEFSKVLNDDRVGPVLGRLALRFLTSSTRMMAGEARNEGSLDETRRPFTAFGLDEAFDERFQHRVSIDDLGWTKEDLSAVLGRLKREATHLCEWLELLCQGFGLRVEIAGNAPVIPTGRAHAWLTLTEWMDPDVLVCFLLAREGHRPDREFYEEWGTITRLFDRDVEAILRRGVSDLHVHLGGVRTANLMWLRVISGRLELERTRYYAPGEVERRARGELDADEARPEAERIKRLIGQFADQHGILGRFWHEAVLPEPIGLTRKPYFSESTLAVAAKERAMLIDAFRATLRDRSIPSTKRGDTLEEVRHETSEERTAHALEDWLDRYIFAKSKFIRRHRQPLETNPGLGFFQEYFHRTAIPSGRGKLSVGLKDEPSVGVMQQSYEDLAAYLAQSRHLKRVELRIGPQQNPRDYHRLFEAWSRAERKFGIGSRRIRFAVHLKRSVGARSKSDANAEGATTSAYRFLCDMDRDTAILHRYRTDPSWEKHAWRISRIDLAGNERDAAPDLASYCMNLIRGDTTALKKLDVGLIDQRAHHFWLIEREDVARLVRKQVPQLGITCHAGEDFAHPIEGLYGIGLAESLLGMREGDTIGHGLAAGTDVRAFDIHHAARRWTIRGHQFDAMLWFYLELLNMRSDPQAIHELEGWLRVEVAALYKSAAIHVSTPAALDGLFRERCQPVRPHTAQRTAAISTNLRHMEVWDGDCAQSRESRVPVAPILGKFSALVGEVQVAVMRRLAMKGVILEFNPSSNWRVSATPDAAAIPFVKIIKMQGGDLRATINTDNPGTFGTRIENEYAIVFHALLEAGFSRAEALERLERMRREGMEGVYLPDVTSAVARLASEA